MLTLRKILSLRDKLTEDTHIIVEGKKDRKALEKLGFTKIIEISWKSDEKIENLLRRKDVKRVAILTDFDREGERKHKDLKRVLERTGIKADFTFRDKFRKTFQIKKIEDVASVATSVDEYYQGGSYSSTRKTSYRKRFLNRRKKKRVVR